MNDLHDSPTQARRRSLSVLARSPLDELERQLDAVLATMPAPARRFLRKPETGLAMVRARAGGSGEKFNLGEMTVTRCAIRLAGGETGIGYVQGRSARHAELAALADALLQNDHYRDAIVSKVIDPLARLLERRATDAADRAASTRVEFFTLVRDAGAGSPA